ncbi:thiosulfate/3-mercaptopyruvate sulfurtransferase [Noviherbaspirillum humi]|uniref:Sulfurtransferase n=1 Tax=Noviherbaspirillum humi TaxID=1688639 RepID=A0A239EES2_9BURK|nr:sulfurtransferase [Noviherbaspirillum humi]SNS42788.1 thiosulfate/3-mercaptopyruvate sulfurtransferase [Noviherbaspirillum humi]
MSFTTLITAQNLSSRLEEPNWIVLDCRHDLANPDAGQAAWQAGHIPGAAFAHLDRDLADHARGPNGEFRGRHPLPSQDAFIATLRRWGVNQDSQVIAYDAHGGMFAARLWWMLRWVGHEAVAVLDGGLQAWQALGLPVTADAPSARPEGNIALRPSLTSTVDVNELTANLATAELTVIDARAPDRFRGENETLDPVGGHIPGAKNRFFKDNLLPDGRFKPAEQLKQEFAPLLPAAEQGVMQCGSGVTACHSLLALEVAGLQGAALYPGSWSEWCADERRPVEK